MHVFADMIFFLRFYNRPEKKYNPLKMHWAEGTGGMSIDVSCKIVALKMVTT